MLAQRVFGMVLSSCTSQRLWPAGIWLRVQAAASGASVAARRYDQLQHQGGAVSCAKQQQAGTSSTDNSASSGTSDYLSKGPPTLSWMEEVLSLNTMLT